jgi:shikimate kinase
MRIYLLGYMASGKTNIGRELARMTGMEFADLDDLFEQRYRISIMDFFEKYGENVFRQMEQKVLMDTVLLENVVISTGGGTPCFFDNMQFIRAQGRSVYLRMDASSLSARLRAIRKKRPLLTGVAGEDLETFVQQQLLEREPYYLQADLVLEGTSCNAASVFEALFPGSAARKVNPS